MNVWSTRLEQQLVVSSALYHYRRANGELPDRSDQLHGDYPNNWMPGLDDPMEHTFQRSLSAAKAEETSNPDSKHAETDFETRLEDRLAGLKPPQMIPTEALGESLVYDDFNEPLEIIVDKQNYRLALVSGNLILRNYPVGLGGERTPTGEFVITEKVKNPNGRSDGDFGSRGMTLSDTLYAIHGTNEPESIGLDQSLGCVRMEAADVEELFDMVTLGTKVTIRDSGLPEEIIRPEERFSLPAKAKETNNSKVYKWLT